MNKENIIRMAQEACETTNWKPGLGNEHVVEFMTRFAALAAAAEREACARVCEGRIGGAVKADGWWSGFREAMRQCAAAIRARSKE